MNAERWHRITGIFHDARRRDPAERTAFVASACAGDEGLRRHVEAMLAAHFSIENGDAAREVCLAPGTLFGRYRIERLLGAGGMAEVYEAVDVRLGRAVALKIISPVLAGDAEFRSRFEREARTIARLDHPNICTLYDLGEENGIPYLVMPDLIGETLTRRIERGPLDLEDAIVVGAEIAEALHCAHEAGVYHRDLKPANILLTRTGVKLLDFGLALSAVRDVSAASAGADSGCLTMPGTIFGTWPYMAPEQLEGQRSDARSDIFALGCVLYEMLTGQRAFGTTLIARALQIEPTPIAAIRPDVPPAMNAVVAGCLAYAPASRWSSAREVADRLRALAANPPADRARMATSTRSGLSRGNALLPPVAVLVLMVLGAAALSLWVTRETGVDAARDASSFTRLTFRTGYVFSAQFVPDGSTIIYSAKFDGEPLRLYQTRQGTAESRPIGLDDAHVADVSSRGELALLLKPSVPRFFASGTLSTMSLTAAAPRPLHDEVIDAQWNRDGELALVRKAGDRYRLEYPAGRVRRESLDRLDELAVSPDGSRVAFVEGSALGVLEPDGSIRTVSANWSNRPSLQWAPRRDEIWVAGSRTGWDAALYAVTLDGRERILHEAPGSRLRLLDVSPTGDALLTSGQTRKGIRVGRVGSSDEHDVSWLDWGHVADISLDGRTVLFTEVGAAGGVDGDVYVRATDGSAAVRLGDGSAQALSPSGRTALAIRSGRLIVLPVGAGETRMLTPPEVTVSTATWFPDERHVLLTGSRAGDKTRSFILDVERGGLRPLADAAQLGRVVSPDGAFVIAQLENGGFSRVTVADGASTPLPSLTPGDEVLRWSDDARRVYVRRRHGEGFVVSTVDLVSGRRETLLELNPEIYGISAVVPMAITPDGRAYVYTYGRHNADLFLARGLQ